MADCAGHFGFINLQLPVYHAGYFKHTITILQCICKKCSSVLLEPDVKLNYLKKLRNPTIGSLIRGSIFKTIVELCKKITYCSYCKFQNGKIKKGVGFFKLIHDRTDKKIKKDKEGEIDETTNLEGSNSATDLVSYFVNLFICMRTYNQQ